MLTKSLGTSDVDSIPKLFSILQRKTASSRNLITPEYIIMITVPQKYGNSHLNNNTLEDNAQKFILFSKCTWVRVKTFAEQNKTETAHYTGATHKNCSLIHSKYLSFAISYSDGFAQLVYIAR